MPLGNEPFENTVGKGEIARKYMHEFQDQESILSPLLLTHSHTMTPFDVPGKQAF